MDDPRNPYDVQPGQVWLNKDTRMQGQIIQILDIDRIRRGEPAARVLIVTDQRSAYDSGAGKHSTVLLRSFRPGRKGYRRLK